MKISKNLLFLVAFVLIGFTACDEAFLEKSPVDQGSVEGFFETQEDVFRAVNGIYDVFQGDIWGGSFYWMHQNFDIMTDNGVGCCPWSFSILLLLKENMAQLQEESLISSGILGYEGIFRANSVLANVDNVEIDATTKNAVIAEARFLRGLMYQEMTNLFGEVPLITTVLTREEGLSATRSSKSDVLAAIYADLDFAEANLDITPFNGDIGRPTKQSAIAVKTRLKMYNQDWAGAAAEAKKIMDMSAANPSVIGLVDDYDMVFSPDNENNKEVLFDIQYTEGTQGEGNFMQVALSPGPEGSPGRGWGSITPTDQLANSFEMLDGLSIDESPMYDPDNPFVNRDARLTGNLFVPGVSQYQGEVYDASLSGFSPFFAVKKWVDLDATIGEGGCSCNETNLILFRYADILLSFAESTNELSGPSDAVYDALNQVRTRAGMPEVPAGLSQADLRDVIRHERHVEFPWEGTRYFDLIRWGIADEMVPQVTLFGESLDARVFQAPKHNLFPIPQKEIDLNGGLTQNAGY